MLQQPIYEPNQKQPNKNLLKLSKRIKFRSTNTTFSVPHQETLLRKIIRRTWKRLRDSGGTSQPFRDAGAELAELQCHQRSCCAGWGVPRLGEPSPTLSSSQGKHRLVISWKCKGSSDYLRSSRAPSPGGVGKPTWFHSLGSCFGFPILGMERAIPGRALQS